MFRWLGKIGVLAILALLVSSAHGAGTVTFTANDTGTVPHSVQFDPKSRALTVDLSALPADATIFRAELRLREPAVNERPLPPTRIYPDGQPDKPLRFVAPRGVGLDALAPVQAAVQQQRPLKLIVECSTGVARLEVSFLQAKPKTAVLPVVTGLRVTHRAGQSLLTFTEPRLADFPQFATGADVKRFAAEVRKNHPGLTFRIWRCERRITPQTIAQAQLVGECGLFTAWNAGYHQDETDRRPPLRYTIADAGQPLAWGAGVYAHNPDRAGAAFYAVTVARDGEEDLDRLTDANTTALAVDETVGPGEPVLQWVEQIPAKQEWMYRPGPLTRMIYTRWEGPPYCSVPSRPVDYLVAIPAAEVEPAPVGLHLHCWGGSLNGGYGWWYNAHRGAILIASNQVPYDWWTGYHECRETGRTFGDGVVRPYTMDRLFAFLDWASQQWRLAPAAARPYWRKLDPTRVFTAGSSMGGSSAPMFAIRYPDRIAWAIGWVGVHVPEESPTFKSSYGNSYGPRDPAITMPDGRTSPWDYFSDVWFLRHHPKAETGLIIASNGKNDGGIGWPQAVQFARALQETRRPHYFNWGLGGHGTRTRIGANFDIDVRADQSLPAFTHCTLDDNLGTGTPRPAEAIAAEQARQAEERRTGKRQQINIDPMDGDPVGQYNAYLAWQTQDLLDTEAAWAMTLILQPDAPERRCRVDLTPRRLQRFKTPAAKRFEYTVTDLQSGETLAAGVAQADELDLLTLQQIPLVKGRNRVMIRAK